MTACIEALKHYVLIGWNLQQSQARESQLAVKVKEMEREKKGNKKRQRRQ